MTPIETPNGRAPYNILYPMANARLPEQAMRRMVEQFDRFESEQNASGNGDRLHALGRSLTKEDAEARTQLKNGTEVTR